MGARNREARPSAEKKAGGRWRTVRGKGGRSLLRAPDGREFEGTPAEVRAAAMATDMRRKLADGLRVAWLTTGAGTDERRQFASSRRRAAIMGSETDAALGLGMTFTIRAPLAIRVEAAARMRGRKADEWMEEVAEGLVKAAEMESGGALPLTRHEREAIERIGGK